jgi:hypothetical protein
MWRILTCLGAILLAMSAQAQDNVTLKAGPGLDLVERYCNVCHSLDYLPMNSRFLNRQGWQTEVNKMITSYVRRLGPPMPRSSSTTLRRTTAAVTDQT